MHPALFRFLTPDAKRWVKFVYVPVYTIVALKQIMDRFLCVFLHLKANFLAVILNYV